jgi:putative ABC transport system permease protein
MSNSSNSFLIEGRPAPPPGQELDGRYRACSPQYFETMGITLLKGRGFTEQDTAKALPVVIVNETLAKRFWPAEDPIGKRIRFTGTPEQNPWMHIVGVIADVRHDLNSPIQPEYYLPYAQDTWRSMVLVARTSAEPTTLTGPIRNEVLNIDPDQPVFDIRTMRQIRERATVIHSFSVSLLSIFAAIALILAAVGIYGVMSYQVSQRTHEIGIRLALGAKGGDVLKMVVKRGMILATIGMSIGLVGAVGITQALKSLLAEIVIVDWSTFVLVSLLLLAVAFVACFIPALRATKVDPMVALRCE